VGHLTVTLPAELREFVAVQAKRSDRSLAAQIRHYVAEAQRKSRNGNATATLPWLADAKQRLEQMQAEHARLAQIDEANAEARAGELAVKIHILAREIEVAELVMRPEE